MFSRLRAKLPRAVRRLAVVLALIVAALWHYGVFTGGMVLMGAGLIYVSVLVAQDWNRKMREREPDADALNWWEKLEGKRDAKAD